MEILNKNTFTDEKVYIEKNNSETSIHIGKACYSIKDLEKIINLTKTKDFNQSLNYRIEKYFIR
jgi:hypothetical protein